MSTNTQSSFGLTATALSLGVISAGAWAALLLMSAMGGMAMAMSPWATTTLAYMFVMWLVMMVAMMVPSTVPMVAMMRKIISNKHDGREAVFRTALFVGGYLGVWAGFSIAATVVQSGLQQGALLSPMLAGTSTFFTGLLFFSAGLFQFSRLKTACLEYCRSPLGFFLASWQTGRWGALRMGLSHGSFCLGCCWALMVLLFTFGVMNLVWVFVLSAVVLIEKLSPFGLVWSRMMGVVLIAGGTSTMIYSAL